MSNRVLALVAGGVALLLAVGGCSSAGAPAPVEPSPTTAAAESDAGSPESAGTVDSGVGPTSPRGARPWKVGERMQLWGPPMSAGIGQYVTVTAIQPLSAKCPGAATPDKARPENGRFFTVEMTIENTPAYDASQPGYYAGSAQTFDWVGADGAAIDQVDNLASFYCTNKMSVFSEMKPGRTYKGFTNVDVPTGAGFLIFGQGRNSGSGFEFEIPAA